MKILKFGSIIENEKGNLVLEGFSIEGPLNPAKLCAEIVKRLEQDMVLKPKNAYVYPVDDPSQVPAQQVEITGDIPDFTEEELLRLTNLLQGQLVRVPAIPWNIITDENWNIPKLGQRVILFSNGVVQDESYTLDRGDDGYFWGREDFDECPEVKEGDAWIPWPSGPTL